ncbi:lipase family protein [Mycobacterium sp. B14F4]|uniref:lipase family protein n=1 Tax=Mycobacterium sp. B14F4 TaxID=3153565 RepID=UPI00325CBDD1
MIALLVGACQTRAPVAAPPWNDDMAPGPITTPLPVIAPDVWADRGSVIREEPLPDDLDRALIGAMGAGTRAVYASVYGLDGSATEVSGAFFVPKGAPPAGGWPVVAMAHATVGTTTDCAPSVRSDLLGYSPGVVEMLKKGYAVALPDYQGLGMPGFHPYLEPRTVAFNVIDSVRAIRQIYPGVSTRWLALGGSQGGQAAWAANELDDFYGGGLDLVGTVAVAPPVDMSPMAQMAYDGTLNTGQIGLTPLLLTSLEQMHPDFPIAKYMHGKALELRYSAIGCTLDAQRTRIQVTADDVRPDTQQDADMLRDMLRTLALPERPLSAPMLVINGLNDLLVLPTWISTAIARACRLGGQIAHYPVPDGGHANLRADQKFVEEWAADRLAGKSAPSNCPQDSEK